MKRIKYLLGIIYCPCILLALHTADAQNAFRETSPQNTVSPSASAFCYVKDIGGELFRAYNDESADAVKKKFAGQFDKAVSLKQKYFKEGLVKSADTAKLLPLKNMLGENLPFLKTVGDGGVVFGESFGTVLVRFEGRRFFLRRT